MPQSTNHVLMIRPVSFGFNTETAQTNVFQTEKIENAQEEAEKEFDAFVTQLQDAGVQVTVIADTEDPKTPDSLFPNNWLSTQSDATLCLYPMGSPNRRAERKTHIIDLLRHSFTIKKTIDFTKYEDNGRYLEGTGSLVFDRVHNIAYACLSPRTDSDVLITFGKETGFQVVPFTAKDTNGIPYFHTNLMMSITSKHCFICLESITDEGEREKVLECLKTQSGKKIVPLTQKQVESFCGNCLELLDSEGHSVFVASKTAFDNYDESQKSAIGEYDKTVICDVGVIEKVGGGSARCLLAELFIQMRETPLQHEHVEEDDEEIGKRDVNRRCC